MILEESWGALGAWNASGGVGLSFVAVVVKGRRRREGEREREREREQRRSSMVVRREADEITRIKKEFFRRRTKVDIQSPLSSLKILLGTPSTDS